MLVDGRLITYPEYAMKRGKNGGSINFLSFLSEMGGRACSGRERDGRTYASVSARRSISFSLSIQQDARLDCPELYPKTLEEETSRYVHCLTSLWNHI